MIELWLQAGAGVKLLILTAPEESARQMRWPYPFKLVARVCNEREKRGFAFYSADDRSITICYHSVNLLFNMAPKPDRPESVEIGSGVIHDISHDEFIYGTLVAVVHELERGFPFGLAYG